MSESSKYLVINKELFEKYYNNTEDCLISIDITTKTIFKSNKAAQKKFGYTLEEFEKLDLCKLYGNIENNELLYQVLFKRLKQNKIVKSKKFLFQKKSQEKFYAKVEVYPVFDNSNNLIFIHVNIKDITLNIELEYKEKYLNTIFESTKEFIVTTFGKSLDSGNKAMYNFFNYDSIDEFKEKHDCICDFFVNKKGFVSAEMDGLTWVEYIVLNPNKIHKAKILKNDKEYIFNINVQKLNFDSQERYMAVFVDITKLHQQYHMIKEKDNMLIYQSKQAALGELINMIAHQWKQPLSAMSLIASNALLDAQFNKIVTSEIMTEYAEQTMEQVSYLTDTINDFRDFLKPTRELNCIKLSELINRLEKVIGKTLKNSQIDFIKQFEDIEVQTYANDCLQVLLCIINNSKDAFLEKNLEKKEIKVLSNLDKDKLNIIIQDNAGGIDDLIIDKVFDPYFTTKPSDIGTGIGLYMTKKIITEHLLGSIKVENKGKGLRTIITLPVCSNQIVGDS